jgi:hypothetical protein
VVAPIRKLAFPWLVAGGIGWAGLAWLGWTLWRQVPPRAGFDLALLLDAARRLAAGLSPYDPGMIGGTAPSSTQLFYSYPPPVAQIMTLVAWLPDGLVLILWGLGATVGLGLVVARLASTSPSRETSGLPPGLRSALVAPLFLPFAVAVLFGNLDAWYPLAYGALVLTVVGRPSSRTLVAAGAAVACVAVAKLHPASLLIWVVGRAWADRDGPSLRVLAAAAVAIAAILGASLLLGGVSPWLDFVAVVRAGVGADLIDPRNIGPVSLLGQVLGLDAGALRVAQAGVTAVAALVTLLAALRMRDQLAGLAVAIAASLVTLPVTWYHYPVGLMPVMAALAVLRPGSRGLLIAATVMFAVGIAVPVAVWAGVGTVLFAAARRVSATSVPGAVEVVSTIRDGAVVTVTERTARS